VRILLWNVHGSWDTAFVLGPHDYIVPVTPGRGPDGRGVPRTYDWPASVREVPAAALRDEDIDVVLLQRPAELALAARWLGREPGRDIAAVYVEHNTPRGDVPDTRHFLADRDDILLVHVTHFNALCWDSGRAPTTVIEHGIPDPGYCYRGDWPRVGVVINEPIRRWRITGTDLLPAFAKAAPLDVFGMQAARLPQRLGVDPAAIWVFDDLPQQKMHAELARRRVYLHPFRWTSLGLSLLEAMLLGMPVVALATTETVEAVPPEAGVVSNRLDVLTSAIQGFVSDPLWSRRAGQAARSAALGRYSLARFHRDWDRALRGEISR
jgi:Glycosyl transferases group 1